MGSRPFNELSKQMVKEKYYDRSRDGRYIRVSGVGYCKRAQGYQLLGYQPLPESGHSLSIFETGHQLHEWMQRRLVALGWIKAKQTFKKGQLEWVQDGDPLSGCELSIINHELRIIGHCDGVTVPLKKDKDGEFYPHEDGERYLIEIKSISDKPNFWVLGIRNGGTDTIREEDYVSEFIDVSHERAESGKLSQRLSKYQHDRKVITKYGSRMCPIYKVKIDNRDELITVVMAGNSVGAFSSLTTPKPAHIAQASLYCSQLDLNKILFIYIGKDIDGRSYATSDDLLNLPIKIFEHEVDDFDVEVLKSKIETIYESVDKGELPSRDYNFEEKSECVWCSFRSHCWPDKVNHEDVDKQLKAINLPEIKLGPNVMHQHSLSLESEYTRKKKVV